jgi:cytosine/adenosine deaminase-related metal-dependent hydrolase
MRARYLRGMLDEGRRLSITRLRGARVATGPDTSMRRDLLIENGFFRANNSGADNELDVSGHLLLPGLINAHDHLELNLFPRLGTRLYLNAGEWAADVYRPGDSPVREHRAIPKPVRLVWGGIKNLLSGVTTVAHHNPYDAAVFDDRFPVRVVRKFGWAHSLEFSADLKDRYNQTPQDAPFIVHAAEGTDAVARSEIRRLEALGVLGERSVLVHANAAGLRELALLRARGCSIVWCPTSNLATYGQTLTTEALRGGIPIALGTDSALTAEVDLLHEIRLARRHCGLSDQEVYRMVTSQSAAILRLENGEGSIREGGVADLIAVADEGQSPAEAIFDLRPAMVMVGGEVKLASSRFGGTSFHSIDIEQCGRWMIAADIPNLSSAVTVAVGSEFRLAGKRVAA